MASLSAEKMSPQHAPCPPHRAPLCPSPSACTSVLPPTPPELPPLRGRRPGSQGGLWTLLCPHSCVCTSVWGSGDVHSIAPQPGVCPGCRGVPLPTPPQGPTHLCPCRFVQSASQVTEHHWCPQCHFLFFCSFPAMDGVPFMISEKFSCVPESVSIMHVGPSVLPPPACALPLLSTQAPPGDPHTPALMLSRCQGFLSGSLQLTLHTVGCSRSDRRAGMRHREGARRTSRETPIQP